MIIDLNEWTSLLVRTKLTPMQLYICFLLHEKSVGNVILYTDKIGFFTKEDMKHLIDNDFIITTKKDYSQLLDFYVTPKFTSLVSLNEEEQGEEFWNEFPSWILIGEKKVPAKAIGKEDAIAMYFKEIKGSVSLHNEIMTKLKRWKEDNHGYATMNMKNFIKSRHWESLTEGSGKSEGHEI